MMPSHDQWYERADKIFVTKFLVDEPVKPRIPTFNDLDYRRRGKCNMSLDVQEPRIDLQRMLCDIVPSAGYSRPLHRLDGLITQIYQLDRDEIVSEIFFDF